MYFPYLRGKQYELIALREIVNVIGKKNNIHPVIEPIKRNDTGLIKACTELIQFKIPFTIIVNPKVGEVVGHNEELIDFINKNIGNNGTKHFGVLIERESDVGFTIERLKKTAFSIEGFNLIHLRPLKDLSVLSGFDPYGQTLFNTIDFSGTNRRYDRNFGRTSVVTLSDPFNLQRKNADYSQTPDEPFTSENIYYKEDGYSGFSDYLTIGEPFSTTGFLPYAVVIHLTYPDSNNAIRIRHFVSDSNEDNSDVPGKFMEALKKMIAWISTSNYTSNAVIEFQRLYSDRHFPGLGTLKKLSILNHLELINSID